MKLTLDIQVRDTKITFGRDTLAQYVKSLPDGYYKVSIEKESRKRGIQQNKYYWGCVVPIVRQGLLDVGIRMDTDEVHNLLKYRFLVVEHVTQDGEVVKSIGHTRDLSTVEFMDYLAQIQQWSSEFLGVSIPDPNEQVTMEL